MAPSLTSTSTCLTTAWKSLRQSRPNSYSLNGQSLSNNSYPMTVGLKRWKLIVEGNGRFSNIGLGLIYCWEFVDKMSSSRTYEKLPFLSKTVI